MSSTSRDISNASFRRFFWKMKGWKRRDILRTLAVGAGITGNSSLLGNLAAAFGRREQASAPATAKDLEANGPSQATRTLEITVVTAPEVQFDHLDVDGLMKAAKDAGVQCVMVYSVEHWGYARYDTKIGCKHPDLHYDLVGKQVEAARRYGLSPLCYSSFNFANKVPPLVPAAMLAATFSIPRRVVRILIIISSTLGFWVRPLGY